VGTRLEEGGHVLLAVSQLLCERAHFFREDECSAHQSAPLCSPHRVITAWSPFTPPEWETFNPPLTRVFVNPNGLGTTPAKDAGIPGLNLDSYYTSGMPNFFVNGTGGFSMGYALNNTNNCNCPLNEQENNFQWVGNVTHVAGNHSLKLGVDVRYAQNLRVPSDSHRSGILQFNAVTTSGPNGGGLPLASFLLGDVSSFNRYVRGRLDSLVPVLGLALAQSYATTCFVEACQVVSGIRMASSRCS
jgi:hypothetical protein